MTPLERIVRNAVRDELRAPASSAQTNAASAPIASSASSAPSSEVLTADQLAAFLGVNRKTVYDGAARGVIPHLRLGRRLVFARAAVMSCLAGWKGPHTGKGF
jgi:excisionase family DNA binding protein